MKILQVFERMVSFELEDGRHIFRPYGSLGACYVLTLRQRRLRAWIQMCFTALMVAILAFTPAILNSFTGLLAFAAGSTIAGLILNGLYTVGLAKTDNVPPIARAQRVKNLRAGSRAMGKPFLWLSFIIASLFCLTSLAIALFLGDWGNALLPILFFGPAAVLFAWQLRLIGKHTNEDPSEDE